MLIVNLYFQLKKKNCINTFNENDKTRLTLRKLQIIVIRNLL